MSTVEAARDELRDLAQAPRSERVAALFDFHPFDWQAAVLDDPTPDVVTTCGRQVGKTWAGAAIAADAFATSGKDEPFDVMIAAKWQETADEMFHKAKKKWLANAGFGENHPEIEKWNETEVESVYGARLFSRTLKTAGSGSDTVNEQEGDTQRGKNPRVIVLDESALVEGSTIEKVIDPMFITWGYDHELYLFSTPRGKQGFHYEKHKNDPDWSEHHIATPDSPAADREWVLDKKDKVDSLTWDQEYLGKFIDLGEVYIPRATYDACTANTGEYDGEIAYLGVDVARKGKDRTVYVPMTAEGTVPAASIRAEDVSDMPGIVDRIRAYHDRHDLRAVGIDENAVGGGVVDFAALDLGGVVHPVKFTTKSKGQMYRKLRADMERGELTLPNAAGEHGTRLRDETVNLQYDTTANGNLKIGHAPGGRDDYADALAIVNFVRGEAAPVRRRSGGRAAVGNVIQQ